MGYSREELANFTLRSICHDPAKATRFLDEISANGSIRDYVLPVTTRHGGRLNLLISSHARRSPGGDTLHIAHFFRDITHLKRVEENLQRNNALLEAISKAQSVYIYETDSDAFFNNLLDAMLAITGSETGFIAEYQQGADGRECLRTLAVGGGGTMAAVDHPCGCGEVICETNSDSCEALYCELLKSRDVVISNPSGRDPGERGVIAEHGPAARCFMGVPIFSGGEMVGAVGVGKRTGGYTRDLAEFIQPMALTIASAIRGYQNKIEKQNIARKIHKINRALQMLNECNTALLTSAAEQKLLEDLCRIIVDVGGYRFAWVAYRLWDEAKSVKPMAAHGADGGYLASVRVSWDENSPDGRGPTGTCIREARTVAVNDTSDESYHLWRAEAGKRGFHSSVALPLIHNGNAFGSIGIYSAEAEAFTGEEMGLLERLAHNLAFGITSLWMADERARAEAALHESRAWQAAMMGAPFDIEHRITAGGKVKWVRARAELELDADGGLVSGVGAVQDVTDRVEAETKMAQQRQQLIQADRLKSLGTLVAGVGHEINNPNNFILLNAPLLSKILEDAMPALEAYYREHGDYSMGGLDFTEVRDAIPKLLEGIANGSHRIKRIVQKLTNFVRDKQDAANSKVCINDIVMSALGLTGNLTRRATKYFHVNLAQPLPRVVGNPHELEQVVINLITNACQSLPHTERAIWVFTGHDREAGQVTVSVVDEGEGIAEDNLGKIFDPFYTTKREAGGTGLGLSVSWEIMARHRGTLKYDSQKGKGTKALMALPAAHA